MEAKIVIVIPVYKQVADLNEYEKRSITNCLKKLAELDCCFAGPVHLKTQYKAAFTKASFQEFSPVYFKGIKGYNRLLKSPGFYRSFSSYTHLLIVQTDAWVFGCSADLLKFTQWDFAGAPSVLNGKLRGYNGGLSLRNVSACLQVLQTFRYFITPAELWKRHIVNNSLPAVITKKWLSFLLDVTVRNNFMYPFNLFIQDNEDIFWSSFVAARHHNFNVITYGESVKFAWEHDLVIFYNTYQLPFGIHGWWNYNLEFWKQSLNEEQKLEMGISSD